MDKTRMTKDRTKTGIPIRRKGDTKKFKDIDGTVRDVTFVKERVIRDPDGNIIGVETEWQ